MDKIQSLEQYLAISGSNIPLETFTLNLLLTAILASILRWIYISYGISLSNRRMFAKNFVTISLTTMIIIAIVKSSLALSLGLVGALSIVRFRAAIKEPEELSYLFLAIAIGLGFGANQVFVTTIGFFIVMIVIISSNLRLSKAIFGNTVEDHNVFLQVSTKNKEAINLERVVQILRKHCNAVDLKRLDETADLYEVSFLVDFESYEKLDDAKNALQAMDNSIDFSFIDHKHTL